MAPAMYALFLYFVFFLMIRRPPRSTLFPLHDALPISVPLLYSVQALDTGVPDGQVWITAPGEPDAYLTVLPAAEPVDRFVLKRFLYLKLDAEAASGTWLLQLYVDGAWRHTATVTGDRQRGLVRLPGG